MIAGQADTGHDAAEYRDLGLTAGIEGVVLPGHDHVRIGTEPAVKAPEIRHADMERVLDGASAGLRGVFRGAVAVKVTGGIAADAGVVHQAQARKERFGAGHDKRIRHGFPDGFQEQTERAHGRGIRIAAAPFLQPEIQPIHLEVCVAPGSERPEDVCDVFTGFRDRGIQTRPHIVRGRGPAGEGGGFALFVLDEPIRMFPVDAACGGRGGGHGPDPGFHAAVDDLFRDLLKRSRPGIALIQPVALEGLITVVDLHIFRCVGRTVFCQGFDVFQHVLLSYVFVVVVPGAVAGHVFFGRNGFHAHFLRSDVRILNQQFPPVGALQNDDFLRLFALPDLRLIDLDPRDPAVFVHSPQQCQRAECRDGPGEQVLLFPADDDHVCAGDIAPEFHGIGQCGDRCRLRHHHVARVDYGARRKIRFDPGAPSIHFCRPLV